MDRLHTLILLDEAGSLTRAAGGDSGKQARMSHHLRELGEFFGAKLTDRVGRTLSLTPKGKELATIARTQFRTLKDFSESVRQTEREWVVGAGDSVLQWWLLPALSKADLPQRWSLHNLRTTEVVTRVADERVDFGVVRRDAVRDTVESADIGVVEYVIVVPNRIRTRNLTGRTALIDLPHATIGNDGQLTARLREVAAKHGGIFKPQLKCDSLGLCMAAVKTGKYAAVLPTYILDASILANVEVLETELDELKRPMALIWNRRAVETLGPKARGAKDILLAALRAEERARSGEG